MRTIITAVCVDPMGWSQESAEDEYKRLVGLFSELLAPHKIEAYRAWSCYPGGNGLADNTELVLFDFGGMLPGTDLPERNARELVKFAEDHPSSLVVITSEMTYERYVRAEMEDRGLAGLHNVVLNCLGEDMPEWFVKANS